jgi:hypothetical protein
MSQLRGDQFQQCVPTVANVGASGKQRIPSCSGDRTHELFGSAVISRDAAAGGYEAALPPMVVEIVMNCANSPLVSTCNSATAALSG